MEKRLDRLSHAAESAEEAQRKLLVVETQLRGFHQEVVEKSQKALMGFAETSDKNILHISFSQWRGLAIKNRQERLYRKRFEEEISLKETMLIEWKQNSLKSVREALKRSALELDVSLLSAAFEEWAGQVGSEKAAAEEQQRLGEVQARLAQFSETQAAHAKAVMARAAIGNDDAIATMAFHAWARGIEELKAERKIEEEAQKIEKQLQEFKERSRNKTAGVMDKMGAMTDTSLLSQALTGWQFAAKDAKKARELENTLLGAEDKFKSLNARHRGNAAKLQTRVTDQAKEILATKVMAAWRLEVQHATVQKKLKQKVESKRKQLNSLQGLFKNFAQELEDNLAAAEDDGKSSARHQPPARGGHGKMVSPTKSSAKGETPKSMSKGGNACSLPALPQAGRQK